METNAESARDKALSDYRKKLSEHREVEARLKESMYFYYNCLSLDVEETWEKNESMKSKKGAKAYPTRPVSFLRAKQTHQK